MADEEKSCWNSHWCGASTKRDHMWTIGMIAAIVILSIALIVLIVVYEVFVVWTCRKSECVQEASRIIAMMDRSMDPCEDFYQYACGAYMADESTKDKSFQIDHINKLNDLVKVLLTENVKYGEPRFLTFPKMLYKACMDQKKIQRDGIDPIKEYVKEFGGWPVTSDNWHESTFNWIALIKQLREDGLPFGYLIQVDYIEDEGAKLLFRGGRTHPNLIKDGVINEDVKSSYLKQLIEIAISFGANGITAEDDMKAVVEFEIQIAKSSDGNKRVERITIDDLQERYPFTNWLIFVRSSLGLNVKRSEIILIVPSYLETLQFLLETAPARVIANYMLAKVHLFFVELLPKNVIYGGPDQPYEERQKLCIDLIRSNLWLAIAVLYQRRFFNEYVFEGVNEMFKFLEGEFEETILKAKWMNEASKKEALKKLKAMQVQIAYPPEIMDIKKMDHFHGDLGGRSALGVWRWIKNFIIGAVHSFKKTNHIVSDMTSYQQKITPNRTIGEPKEAIDVSVNVRNLIAAKVDHRNTISKYNWRGMGEEARWLAVSDQIQVHAKYEPEYNMLDIRAGILRSGYYHYELPYYVNFGAIGAILARELVHSIDNKGKSFDEFGKLRHAWRDNSKKILEQKFKCIKDQYKSYVEPLTGRALNGSATLEEDIADNIGLTIAYRAYINWTKRNGNDKYLPGINMTNKQLFWVSNAQTQCANPSVSKIYKQLELSNTTPERYRVVGSISNSADFAKDFKCPEGSPMNPKHKCKLC